MRKVRIRRPSPAMVVAILALVIALGGTAFAGPVAQFARLISGDKLIRTNSLSGNRLRNHTLTANQINMAALGTVPAANFANTAGAAHTANFADTAGSASQLNGLGPGAFKISCPSDTTLAAGECVETADRAPDALFNAYNACAAAGRRLASIGELFAFGTANPTAMTANDWTDSVYDAVVSTGGSPVLAGTAVKVNGNSGYGAAYAQNPTTSHPYRCVTGPSN